MINNVLPLPEPQLSGRSNGNVLQTCTWSESLTGTGQHILPILDTFYATQNSIPALIPLLLLVDPTHTHRIRWSKLEDLWDDDGGSSNATDVRPSAEMGNSIPQKLIICFGIPLVGNVFQISAGSAMNHHHKARVFNLTTPCPKCKLATQTWKCEEELLPELIEAPFH